MDDGLLGTDWGVSVLGVLLDFLLVSLTLVSLALVPFSEAGRPTDLRKPPFRVFGVDELRVAICGELTCAHGFAFKDERGGRPGRTLPDPKPVSTTGGSCQPVLGNFAGSSTRALFAGGPEGMVS